jgi:hypothetical protein
MHFIIFLCNTIVRVHSWSCLTRMRRRYCGECTTRCSSLVVYLRRFSPHRLRSMADALFAAIRQRQLSEIESILKSRDTSILSEREKGSVDFVDYQLVSFLLPIQNNGMM